MEESVGARLRIQQLINDLMAVDTEFRVRGLRDPSHVAFMAQFLNTLRTFSLPEQERQLHARIKILRRILDVDHGHHASIASPTQAFQAAQSHPAIVNHQQSFLLSSSDTVKSDDGFSAFDAAQEPQLVAIREREDTAFSRKDILARYRSYRRFAIGVIRSHQSASFKLADLHSAFDAAKKEAIAQQSDNLPPHFKLTRSDNVFSNRVMKFSDLRRAADIGDLDGLTCEIINRVKTKGRPGALMTETPPASAPACPNSAAECGTLAAPFAGKAAGVLAAGSDPEDAGAGSLTEASASDTRGACAVDARCKRRRALPSPRVRDCEIVVPEL